MPRDLSELAQLTAEYHTHCHRAFELTPKTLQKLLRAFGLPRRTERLPAFLAACQADAKGRLGLAHQPYPQVDFLAQLAPAMKVDAAPLMAKGLTGKSLGDAILRVQQAQLKEAKQAWLAQHS